MRFYYYTTVLIGIMFLLAAAGYDLPVSGGIMKKLKLINSEGDPTVADIKTSSFWGEGITGNSSLKAILLGLAAAGLIIGVIGRAPDISYLLAAIVFAIATAIMADYIAILNIIIGFNITWVTWVATIIFGGLLAGFFITTIEFWRGTD